MEGDAHDTGRYTARRRELEDEQYPLEQTAVIPDLENFLSAGNSPKSALLVTFELDVIIFMRWP